MTLRQDSQQWLIYQEDSVTASVRALEALAMLIAGPILAQHSELSMRALGNAMVRLGEQRQFSLLDSNSEVEVIAGRHLATILGEMIGVTNAETARDELHAAVFWLDSVLQKAGIKTDSWVADAALGKR